MPPCAYTPRIGWSTPTTRSNRPVGWKSSVPLRLTSKLRQRYLGLTPILNKNNEVIGYEDEQAKKIDKLVQDLVGGNNAYSVLSGAAHSEFWSLLGGYQGRPPTPAGLSPDEHESDPESFVPLVRACLQALFKPIDLASEMFDRGALAKDLDRIYKRAVGVMGL